jgi:hypothetical protein
MRVAIVSSILFLTAAVAGHATLLQDPNMEVDNGGDAIGITSGINQVQPCGGSRTCDYSFFNDTGAIITSFTFETTIAMNLSPDAQASFTCSDPGGFFKTCTTMYDPPTGDLEYSFSGVFPPIGNANGPGEERGIAPGAIFTIGLNGWVPDAMSAGQTLYEGLPTFTTSTFTTSAPEPSTLIGLGSGLLFFGLMWRRRRTAR